MKESEAMIGYQSACDRPTPQFVDTANTGTQYQFTYRPSASRYSRHSHSISVSDGTSASRNTASSLVAMDLNNNITCGDSFQGFGFPGRGNISSKMFNASMNGMLLSGEMFPTSNCTVTRPIRVHIPRLLFSIFKLVVSLFGLTGNTLSILVLARKNNRNSSTAIYLMTMAFVDNISLIVHPLAQSLEIFSEDFVLLHGVKWFCMLNNYLDKTSVCISHWMPVLVTIERVISVQAPFKVKQICMPRSSILITTSIWIVFTSAYSFQFVIAKSKAEQVNNFIVVYSCEADIAPDLLSVISWVEYTVTTLIPLVIVVVGNVIIIGHVIISSRFHKKTSMLRRGIDKQLLTMLVLMSSCFVITSFPYSLGLPTHAVSRIGEPDSSSTGKNKISNAVSGLAWNPIFEFLPYLNSSFNFLFFFLSGSRFRTELKKLFLCSESAGNVYSSRTSR